MFKVLDQIRPYVYLLIGTAAVYVAIAIVYTVENFHFLEKGISIFLLFRIAYNDLLFGFELLGKRRKFQKKLKSMDKGSLVLILAFLLPGISNAQNDPFKIIPEQESTAWDWGHYKRNASLYSFSFSAGLFTGAEKQLFSIAKYRNTILPQAPIQEHPDGYTFQDYRDRWLGPESANGYGTWYRGWHWYEINDQVRLYKRKWFLSGPGYMFRDARHTMEFGKIWSYRLAAHYYQRPRNKWQHTLDLVLVAAAQGLGQMVITSILVKN